MSASHSAKLAGAAVFAMLLTACQPKASEPVAASRTATTDPLTFAQAACGGCHAVESETLSPNPQAPAFAEIANRDGLTRQSLGTWLRDAHNYPEVMDFDLDADQIEMLADHMITLRREDYEPPIS